MKDDVISIDEAIASRGKKLLDAEWKTAALVLRVATTQRSARLGIIILSLVGKVQ